MKFDSESQSAVPNNINNQAPMNNELKTQLETAYNKVQSVIKSKGSYADFKKVFEENTAPGVPPILDSQWGDMLPTLSLGFPDLSKVHYVSSEADGDYAYYFAWVEIAEEPNKMNVWAYVFHKAADGWKLSGYSQNQYVDKATTDAENNKTVQELIPDLKKQVSEAMNSK